MTKKQKIDLLPCPFCGSRDVGVVIGQKENPFRSQVLCQGCGARAGLTFTAQTPSANSHDLQLCIKAWNTRLTNK